MFDDLYAPERASSLSQMVQRPAAPETGPGAFAGFGGALADSVPSAALTAGSAWSALLDAYGKAAAYRDAPTVAMINGEPAPDMDKLKRETIDQMGNSETARTFREQAKKFAPDPAAVGVAGQVVHGLVSTLTKAVAYSATTGPAAPIVFGGDMGINRAQELSDQGVDGATAAKAGIVTGIVSAAGLKLPPALGATRLQSAVIGAGINPVMGISERGTIHALLDHADYPTIAAQYKPFDPTQLAIEALAGAAFGGIFHSTKAREGATLTPDEHAATLVMNEVRARDADTLTRPGDINALNAAHDAQALAAAQLDGGEMVSIAHLVTPYAPTLEAARAMAFERMTADMRAELLAEAGNRAEPGEIVALKAEREALAAKLDEANSKAAFLEEAKSQQKHGLSRKQAESAARKAIEQRVADLQAQAERMDATLERNRRATQAEQDLATLAKGEIPERFGGAVEDQAEAIARGFQRRPIAESVARMAETPGGTARASEVKPASEATQKAAPVDRDVKTTADLFKSPEIDAAQKAIEINPDMTIRLDDGTDVRATDVLREADAAITQASTEANAFKAAITCALRYSE